MPGKYKIESRADFFEAKAYIERAMKREDSGISQYEGYTEFRNADSPEALQAWCESYLDIEKMKKLRQAVRVAKSRSKNRGTANSRMQIDISFSAHFDLKSMCRDLKGDSGKALQASQFIERVHAVYEDWLMCGYSMNKEIFRAIMSGADIDELKENHTYLKQ